MKRKPEPEKKKLKQIPTPAEAAALVPPRLVLNIGTLVAYTKTMRDVFIIIVSKEGEGKSTLAQIMGAVSNGFAEENGQLRYALDSNIYDETEFKTRVFQTLNRFYIADEGTSMFLRADSNTKWGKERVKVLSQMRSRRHIFIVTLTESGLCRVDPQILHDRATAMIRITKRGRFQWFNKQNMRRLEVDPAKRMIKRWPDMNWAANFKKLPNKYYKQYETYKHNELEKYNTDEDNINVLSGYITPAEAKNMLGYKSVTPIYSMVKKNEVRWAKDAGNNTRINREDIRKLQLLIKDSFSGG